MNDKTYLNNFLIRLLCCIGFIFMISYSVRAHEGHDEAFLCSYYGEPISPQIKMGPAEDAAIEVIGNILSVVGLRSNFEIRSANVPNAAAVIFKNKRYILYNPKFMSRINYASGTNWAGISILAHEIGHHLNGHTLQKGGSRPDLELEADEFSGFVLNKLGADKTDAQAAMNVAASQKSSHTHPARKDRLVAIAGGWDNADVQMGSVKTAQRPSKKSSQTVTKPALVEVPVRNELPIDQSDIAFSVYFNADRTGQYFITNSGQLVNVDDDSVYLIGRLAESNRRGYKLMLSDKNYNYLYIGSKGRIVNGSGRDVGYIDRP